MIFSEEIKFFCKRKEILEKYPIYLAQKRHDDLIEKFQLNEKTHITQGHEKRCPGIMDIIFYGYIVPSWSDISILVKDNQIASIIFADRDTQYSLFAPKSNINVNSNWCSGHLKITNPWNIKTEKNTNVIYDRLPYKNENIFEAATGLYDSSIDHQMHIFLKITNKDGHYMIKAGTPLLQIFPIKTASFKMTFVDKELQLDKQNYNDKFLSLLKRYNKKKFKYSFK